MSRPSEIGTEIETTNGLQSLQLVNALVARVEKEREMNCELGAEACLELLKQTTETTAYDVLVSDELKAEIEEGER